MAGKKAKVVIAAGGTGGHVFPGIAVAERLTELIPGIEVVFIGTKKGLEGELVPKHGYAIQFINAGRIKGEGILKKFLTLASLPFSTLHAMSVLLKLKPAAVVSIGGYAAVPVVISAWMAGVPVFLIEPNAVPGASNRKLAKFAKKVFVAFDNAARFFKKDKVVKAGVPVRKEVLAAHCRKSEGGAFTIFVFGGSQGARRLNLSMADAAAGLSRIGRKIKIIHQGGRDVSIEDVKSAYRNFEIEAEVFAFTDKIWECYARADVVIGRAGASTVTEVMALGIPSIFVPYPYAADDHQRANAASVAKCGGAIMIEDSECSGERLLSVIRELALDPEKLKKMQDAFHTIVMKDAAEVIALEVEGVLN